MRIATQQIYNIANIGIADAQQAILRTEEQISTGKRVVNPADDPIAATVTLQVREALSRSEQFQKNIDVAENVLELEEVTLSGVVNTLQRLRELAVQAGNSAVLTEGDYRSLASEVDSRLDELLNLVNTRNTGGDFIFAGYQSSTQPYVNDGGGGISYRGDEGFVAIQVSSIANIKVSDSGKRIFEDIDAAANTVSTRVNPANRSSPPIAVSVGQITDQAAFDAFYPEDLVLTFNTQGTINPPAANYTITERSTGRVLVANQIYQPGTDIEVNGISFRVGGVPFPGTSATPSTIEFGQDVSQIFAGDETGETLRLTVGGKTETLTITSDLTNNTDLVNELTSGANGALLANLGLTVNGAVTPPRFEVPTGLTLTIDRNGGSGTNILNALGIFSGTQSNNGVLAVAGDSVFIDSTPRQGLLTALSRFSDALNNVDDDSADTIALLEDVVALTLDSINNAEINITSVQSEIGARLNVLDSTRDLHLDSDLLNREVLSDLEDLDFAEAATRLSLETFILQAAQQTFVRVSSLSLFNIL